MDTRIEVETRSASDFAGAAERRTVSFSKVDTGPANGHEYGATAEEFEIGIGSWRAKIVKEPDEKAGRPRFWTRFDAVPRDVWTRRRMQRLADRLNARRRLSD